MGDKTPFYFDGDGTLTCRGCGTQDFRRGGSQWDTETVMKQYTMVYDVTIQKTSYGVEQEVEDYDYDDCISEESSDTVESGEDREFDDEVRCTGCKHTMTIYEIEELEEEPEEDEEEDEDEDEDEDVSGDEDDPHAGMHYVQRPAPEPEPEPEPERPMKAAQDIERGDIIIDQVDGQPKIVREITYENGKVKLRVHMGPVLMFELTDRVALRP